MPDYAAHRAADVRLRMLMILHEQRDDRASSALIREALLSWAHDLAPDYIRRQADHLEEIDAITLTMTADPDLYVAQITQVGVDHLKGRTVLPGVRSTAKKS